MRATELRIGNYHYYRIEDKFDERKEWDEICQIDYDDLRILSIKDEINKDYNPIPLTEEWLSKFEFEKSVGWDDMVYFNNNGIHIYLCGNDKEDWFEYENDIVIKSVHQLQNLYFALTGLELTLNK